MSLKLVIVGVVAVTGVGLASWAGYSQLGPAKTARSASAGWESRGDNGNATSANASASVGEDGGLDVDVDGDPGGDGVSRVSGGIEMSMDDMPAWMSSVEAPEAGWRFEPVADSAEAGAAADIGTGILEEIVTGSEDLGALGGASKLSLIDSWRTFIRPILADEPGAFSAAVASLGGVVSEGAEGEGPAAGLFERLQALLGGSSVDWRAATTRRADPSNAMDVPRMMAMPGGPDMTGSVPLMTMVMREENNGVTTERRAVSIPMHALFPDAVEASEGGAPTVEVWTPTAMRSGARKAPDAGVAVFFVWDASARRWSPIAMRITLETEHAADVYGRMQRENG